MEDITNLKTFVEKLSQRPNYLKIKGKALLSTFAGESSLFGQANLSEAWSFAKTELSKCGPVLSFLLIASRRPLVDH